MRAALALVAHRAHVAHVTFDMGDPLGNRQKKRGAQRKLSAAGVHRGFSRPPEAGHDSRPTIFAGFREFSRVFAATPSFSCGQLSSPSQ